MNYMNSGYLIGVPEVSGMPTEVRVPDYAAIREDSARRVVGHDPCWWQDRWRSAFTHANVLMFPRRDGMGCRE